MKYTCVVGFMVTKSPILLLSFYVSDVVARGQDLTAEPLNKVEWPGFSGNGLISWLSLLPLRGGWHLPLFCCLLSYHGINIKESPSENAREGLGLPTGAVTASMTLSRRPENGWHTSSGKGFPSFASHDHPPSHQGTSCSHCTGLCMDAGGIELNERWSYVQRVERRALGRRAGERNSF